MDNIQRNVILIKGAGDLASAIAVRLHRSGYAIVMTDIKKPSMVRRTVSFAEAIYQNTCCIENINACISDIDNYNKVILSGSIPVLLNIKQKDIEQIKPCAVVDAIIAKKNLGTYKNPHYYTIGLGPGFHAPDDVDVTIETRRGHSLGRCIYDGTAEKNTGIPGVIHGYGIERVLRSPIEGTIYHYKSIGDSVCKGDIISTVRNKNTEKNIVAQIDGMIRGLIHPFCPILEGTKTGDIDPRNNPSFCHTVSDKGLALGGAVLEALLTAKIYPQSSI